VPTANFEVRGFSVVAVSPPPVLCSLGPDFEIRAKPHEYPQAEALRYALMATDPRNDHRRISTEEMFYRFERNSTVDVE
jgi:hypothetical protein